MDNNDITKIACRKLMNVDADKLQEKVAREKFKLIKLKVAQDTAFWDLKEKMKQTENNHEKLQQNMVEVQMQLEEISTQYQEELRLRPDTLNKFSSAHEICNVLEDYSEQLKDKLLKLKTDKTALYEAYERTGQLVKEMKTEQVHIGDKNRIIIEGLQDKVKLMTDHQNQLLQHYMTAKQQGDSEISDLLNKLTSVNANNNELIAVTNELNKQFAECKLNVEKKEEMNANVRAELTKVLNEFESQSNEARGVFEKQNEELNKLNKEKASLTVALSNQEQFTSTLLEQQNALQEKTAVIENKYLDSVNTLHSLKKEIKEISISNQCLQNNITDLTEEKQRQLQEINNKKEILKKMQVEKDNIITEYSKLDVEKKNIMDELNKAGDDCNSKATELNQVTSEKVKLEEEIVEMEDTFKLFRESSEERIKELTELVEVKVKEKNSRTLTVNQLISEIKTTSDTISQLDVDVKTVTKEIEKVKIAFKEKEKKLSDTIGQLETIAREKDKEFSKQMSAIREMRNEKDRLQKKIENMQNSIDNIQKTLIKPAPRATPSRMEPDLDDNAVMLTPSHKDSMNESTRPTDFAAPRSQQARQSKKYTLLSDSSDGSERFEHFMAHGRSSPTSMALRQRKRRGRAMQTPCPPALRPQPTNNE